MAAELAVDESKKDYESLSFDDDIEKFLNIADLQSVGPAIRKEGVTKIGHIIDVNAEDLAKLGFTAIQIKRFQRCWENVQSRHINPSVNTEVVKNAGKKSTPWREVKFGYIPHPQTKRATFLNEKVLPHFYESKWKWAKNSREFVKQFHTEGRRQYDLSQSLESLDKSLQSILDTNSQQSAGSLLIEEKILSPSDAQSIKFNIERLEALDKKANTLESSLKIEDEKIFVKSGKILTGEECAHKFNEECFSSLMKIKYDISKTMVKLRDIDLKHKRMYPTKSSFVSKKRKQKENRAKCKKRKLVRQDTNCKRVFSLITSPDSNITVADVSDINFNNVPKIGTRDARWLKILVQQKKFTDDACLKMNPLLLPSVLKIINNQEEEDDDTDHDGTEEEDTCVLDIVDYEI